MEAFRNFISGETIGFIGQHLARRLDSFDAHAFSRPLLGKLPSLGLKQRVQLVADAVHAALPAEVARRNDILRSMLHPETEATSILPSDDDGIRGWGLWPLTRVVGQHGLADFDDSLALLRDMTKRGTAEFDVRPFLDLDQARALRIITSWTSDPNVHVRRLASEGTRPRLPWGMQLKQLVDDPSPCIPILTALRDDPEDYVRRSVANHINDISKDHPDRVAQLAEDWMKHAPAPRKKLIRHACRTLIKSGHVEVLATFGVAPPCISSPVLEVRTPVVMLGGAVEFSLRLTSTARKSQKIILDYLIHFQKANGMVSPKVFKWTQLSLQPGQDRLLKRSHKIRPITTRSYYPGEHAISLRINGVDFGHKSFQLVLP